MSEIGFFGLVSDALKRFPAGRWIFGVVAVTAAVALAKATQYPWQVFAFGSIGVFLCGGMLAVAGAAYAQRRRNQRPPGTTVVFVWFCLFIFAAWSVLFTSCVFFSRPKDPRDLLGLSKPRTLSEQRAAVRKRLEVVVKHPFYTDRNFEASVAQAEALITQLCEAMVSERAALAAGGSDPQPLTRAKENIERKKALLENYRGTVAGIRQLDEQFDGLSRDLVEMKVRSELPPGNTACIDSTLEQVEAFRSLIRLIADWIERSADSTYEATPGRIETLTKRARPNGAESRFVNIPAEIEDCLSKIH